MCNWFCQVDSTNRQYSAHREITLKWWKILYVQLRQWLTFVTFSCESTVKYRFQGRVMIEQCTEYRFLDFGITTTKVSKKNGKWNLVIMINISHQIQYHQLTRHMVRTLSCFVIHVFHYWSIFALELLHLSGSQGKHTITISKSTVLFVIWFISCCLLNYLPLPGCNSVSQVDSTNWQYNSVITKDLL